MTLTDLLHHLEGVSGGDGQYMAKCPAHDDRRASLSVGVGEDRRILLKCHAGCTTEDITAALGLTVKDLFDEVRPEDVLPHYDAPRAKKSPIVATYHYPGGVEKLRRADKSFTWRQPDEKGGWDYHKPKGPLLYVAGELTTPGGPVVVVEGEKDADTAHGLGMVAVSAPDGAGPGKWKGKADYERLRGCSVFVIPDHDRVGQAFAEETCTTLQDVAEKVYLLDLATVWPEIPEHGDLSDMVAALGEQVACDRLAELMQGAEEWTPGESQKDGLLSLFRPLGEFKEEEATWLVHGWIPEAQITLIAADGGVGKTTLWVDIIAALSSGRACILDPPEHTRPPQKVVFCTTEDSIRKKLLKKLREAGANMSNIRAMDMTADRDGALREFKFGTSQMDRVLRYFKSAVCIFDPVQGFVPPDINMGSRNAMRDCMAPLISIGEDVGTTFLVICHTNKRKGASGRDRIADSADLWDIARSVIMMGYTEAQGVRYLSNEKNNYAPLQETILFSINDAGQIQKEGTTWKRDRDYMLESTAAKSTPKREDCKVYILQTLEEAGGSMKSDELSAKLETAGYAFGTIKRAKSQLKKDGKIQYFQIGSSKDGSKEWHTALMQDATVDFEELPQDTPVPFEHTPSA